MRRKTAHFYNLRRPKLRASWNKLNLYHIKFFRSPVRTEHTLYKQKWVSKSASRKYHGETVAEKHWTRLFRPTVRSVVSMDAEALAADDGRKESAGRGSGQERKEVMVKKPKLKPPPSRTIPYSSMVYAALERRLDMAVWRALFASSARQARQFCIHGYVKVNGQKMVYPGYMLNPGDMFQVEPERVMFATGAEKDSSQRREGRVRRRLAKKGVTPLEMRKAKKKTTEANQDPEAAASAEVIEEPALDNRATLKKLLETSKIISSNEPDAKANRKRALRDFSKLVRKTMSRTPRGADSTVPADATAQLRELMATLNIQMDPSTSSSSQSASATPSREPKTSRFIDVDEGEELIESTKPKRAIPLADTQTVRSHQQAQLAVALQEARDNPVDATKPYATPWRPRPFMSPFAFVPRYLEVQHAICAAVYIRHPVARAGLAEVPTPFDGELLALAHNWYLRRR